MRSLRLTIAATIILSAIAASAQNTPSMGRIGIRGSVRDSQTHQPLYRVIVDVESQSGGNAEQAVTDSTGKFSV
jgi:hypothetical protein